MIPPKRLVFDWDNTLVNSWHRIHFGWQKTLEEYALPPINLEEVKRTVRLSARESFASVFGEASAQDAIARYRFHYSRYPHPSEPVRGAEKLLKFCVFSKISCGVISNKSHDFLLQEIAQLGWSQYFSLGMLGAGHAKADKPDAEALLTLLPESADWVSLWYVGDTGVDILFAHNCGLPSVLIGDNLLPGDPNPDHKFYDLDVFREFLQNLFPKALHAQNS